MSFTIVGVGPGDPELLTIKAVKAIEAADVICYHAGKPGSSKAKRIASHFFPADVTEYEWVYPVTAGISEGYYEKLDTFYDDCAATISRHLDAGDHIVLLAEGDPLLYGSAMYVADRFPHTVIPGITSVSAATAAHGYGLCRHEDVLTYLPGTLPVPELARRLADTQAAVIMKLGRTFPGVVEALRQAGRLHDAFYVEYASMAEQRVMPVTEVDPTTVPYLSVIVVPGNDERNDAAGRAHNQRRATESVAATSIVPSGQHTPGCPDTTPTAEVLVIGLGPGPENWLTPEANQALAEVNHVVGYAPYVNRVPQRAGLTRHASGNTVEVDRARLALELAAAGEKVAVVSGGDAGVFGMAAAVFEAAEAPEFRHIYVRVLPGLTAAQAVAATAGAPLGGDFAIVNLSDRLKPWPLLERRLTLLAEADVAICLYNPASRTRTEQIGKAKELLLTVKSPETLVIIGRDIGRDEHELRITTLGELDPTSIDMKCLVMICPSTARKTTLGQVWTPRFTLSN